MPESGFLHAVEILAGHYLTPEHEFARKIKPAAGQRTLMWDEDSHPRETDEHDGKRPGEFAPKEHEGQEKSGPEEEFKSPFHGDDEERHWYGASYRPIGHATVPRGFVETKKHDAFRHCAVAYSKPLTDEEQYQYELTPIRSEKEIPALAQKMKSDILGDYADQYLEPGNEDMLADRLKQEDARKLLGHVDTGKVIEAMRSGSDQAKPEDAADKIYSAMSQFRDHDKGALITAKELRQATGLDKAAFDAGVYQLAKDKKVMPHKHDFATSLKPDELEQLVDSSAGDPARADMHPNEGRYWVGFAKRKEETQVSSPEGESESKSERTPLPKLSDDMAVHGIKGGKGRFNGCKTVGDIRAKLRKDESLSVARYGGGDQIEIRSSKRHSDGRQYFIATAEFSPTENSKGDPITEKYPSLAEPQGDPSKMSLSEKLAWQKENPGKGRIKSPEKAKPKQMASVSGAKYEFVKDNGDGTATVRNEQGDEFSTDPGEPWSLDKSAESAASPQKSAGDNKPFKPESVPGEQMGLFNTDQHGQKALFNVVKPDKKAKKSEAAPSTLEKIQDEGKARSEASKPLPGQRTIGDHSEDPRIGTHLEQDKPRPVDQSLWTTSKRLSSHGDSMPRGDQHVLTLKGAAKAFNVANGSKVSDKEFHSLEVLGGGQPMKIEERIGSKIQPRNAEHWDNWDSLQRKGYVDPLYSDPNKQGDGRGYVISEKGKDALRRGYEEGDRLLDRVKAAHPIEGQKKIGEPDDNGWSPENHVKIAADSIGKLRRQDVYRLLDNATGSRRDTMASYISKNRPDLAGEVHDALSDLNEESGQQFSRKKPHEHLAHAIHKAISQGGKPDPSSINEIYAHVPQDGRKMSKEMHELCKHLGVHAPELQSAYENYIAAVE